VVNIINLHYLKLNRNYKPLFYDAILTNLLYTTADMDFTGKIFEKLIMKEIHRISKGQGRGDFTKSGKSLRENLENFRKIWILIVILSFRERGIR